jgi:hypothetical protein
LQRAYDVAVPGQVVEVAGGNYGSIVLAGSKPAPGVVFRPASGAVVSLGVRVDADNVEFRDMRIGYWEARYQSDGLVMRNIDSDVFGIYGSSNTKVIGGDVGPSYNPGGSSTVTYVTWGNSGTVLPRNITFDGVYFHDFRRGTPEDHMECVFVTGVDGLTIRNSKFQRCDVFSIYFGTPWWGAPDVLKNVVIENNFFDESTLDGGYGQCCTHYAVRVASDWDRVENLRLAYNSALQPVSIDGVSFAGVSVIGNVAPWPGCEGGVTYAYNVWQHDSVQKCNSTDKGVVGSAWGTNKLGFANPAAVDLHLTSTSPAVNAGNPQDHPSVDIDGQARTGLPDAGADERQ